MNKIYLTALLALSALSANAGRNTNMLLAQSNYMYTGGNLNISDSGSFIYVKHQFGGQYNEDLMRFGYDYGFYFGASQQLFVKDTVAFHTSNGQIKTIMGRLYNGTAWVPNNYLRAEYVGNGNSLAVYVEKYFQGMDDSIKYTYSYLGGSKKDQILTEKWDNVNNIWVPDTRTLYRYKNNGVMPDTVIEQQWVLNAWADDERTINTYTQIYNTEYVYQTYNGSSWNNVFRQQSNYNLNTGRLLGTESQMWNANTWTPTSKEVHAYSTSSNELTDITHSQWNNSAWEPARQTQFTYDKGHVTEASLSWNAQANKFELQDFDAVANRYYQWTAVIDDAHVSAATLSVYPVPAHDKLFIDAEATNNKPMAVTVTDMQGRVAQRAHVQPVGSRATGMLDVSALPAGNYILRIESGASRKITISK